MVEGGPPCPLHRLLQYPGAGLVRPVGEPLQSVGGGAREDLVGHRPPPPVPHRLGDPEPDPEPTGPAAEQAVVPPCPLQCAAVMAFVLGQSTNDIGHRLEGRPAGLGHGMSSLIRADEAEAERPVNGKLQPERERRLLAFAVFAAPVHEHGFDEATDLIRAQSCGGGEHRFNIGDRRPSGPAGTSDQRP